MFNAETQPDVPYHAVLGLAPREAMRRLAEAGVGAAAAYDRVRTKLYRRSDLAACRPAADAA